jgi:hypothetical protein
LNIAKILAELKSERDSINQAIALLAKIKSLNRKELSFALGAAE